MSDPMMWMHLICLFIFGVALGSFANVIIVRLPVGESFVTPRSHCRQCRKQLLWQHNIPLFSYLYQRGKCAYCGAGFSPRYFLIELLMGCAFCATYLAVGEQWILLEYLILVFGLVTVSFIDIDHMILPDSFTLSGIVIGLVGSLLNPERTFLDSLMGVLLGGGFLWLIAYLYWITKNQEGMGGGDIKLLAWIGAVLGWKCVPFVILFTSLVGSLVGVLTAARSEQGFKTEIPFGPFLALG
ncbi:MAG: A24 family peptidase, partial [Pseudobdellovibrionaceae bacterium]